MPRMFKGSVTLPDGRPLLVFGLSTLNLERLPKDMPIIFDTHTFSPVKARILIFHGSNELAMARQLEEAGIQLPPGQIEIDIAKPEGVTVTESPRDE